MGLLQKIYSIGQSEGYSDNLNEKIKTSNILGLSTSFGAALPFIFITYFLYPTITWIPILGFFSIGLGMLLNSLSLHQTGRAVISLSLFSLATLYHAFLLQKGDSIIQGLYILQLTFAIFPFLVFSLKNKKSIILTLAFCFLGLFYFPELKVFLKEDLDSSLIRDSWLNDATIFMGVSLFFTSVLILCFTNDKVVEKSRTLYKDVMQKNQEMEEKQEELNEKLAILKKNQTEEEKRNWVTTGISKLSDIIRSKSEDKNVFDEALKSIINYTQANQGILFVKEIDENANTNEALIVKATYAFNRKKNLQLKLNFGEGLPGQAWREKDEIYLTDLPANYVNIRSGLGDATPKNVFILPLIYNEKVEGVIELASFTNFDEYIKDFIRQSGITLASLIFSERTNSKTKELLEETQEKAEMMRSQEEEMRQNMEELQATQEESERRSKEYESEIYALKERLSQYEELDV